MGREKNLLFWIDSTENKACIFNPETGKNKTYALGQDPGTGGGRKHGDRRLGRRPVCAESDERGLDLKIGFGAGPNRQPAERRKGRCGGAYLDRDDVAV